MKLDALKKYKIWTDSETVNIDDIVTITDNPNSYDNFLGVFEEDLYYCFVCDLQPFDLRMEDDGYKYIQAKVTYIHERGY